MASSVTYRFFWVMKTSKIAARMIRR